MFSSITNKGSVHETVVPTLMAAEGNLAIITRDGIAVDYKETDDLDASIDQLAQAPGLAWMDDLCNRDVASQFRPSRAWGIGEKLNSQTKCNTGIVRSCNGKAL